jgi:streptogramin lyase
LIARRFLFTTGNFWWVYDCAMTTRAFPATVLATVILAAASLAAQSSTLGSLFDRYDVKASFAGLAADGWGASTTSVAADGKGQVIVMVRAVPYFRVFTPDGKPVKTWGDAGLFTLAHSVHVAPDGSLWASDPQAHVVHKFSQDGKLLLTLGKKGVAGDDTSREAFNQPNGLGFAPNGDIYVSDGYVNSRVVQFTADGKFARIIGGKKGSAPGELQVPHGVAIDAQGRIIVADSDNKRLSVFDKDGRFVKVIAAPSRGGVVATADGTIYVSDVNAGVVTLIRNDQIADVIKVDGRPHGLSVDPTTGDVYTSSTNASNWNVTRAALKKK